MSVRYDDDSGEIFFEREDLKPIESYSIDRATGEVEVIFKEEQA